MDNRMHLFSRSEVTWPEGPMTLWQKVGGLLVIAMLLFFVVLASVTERPGAGEIRDVSERSIYP